MMGIFLAFGFLMTLGWGGINVILVSVARIGLVHRDKGPEDPTEKGSEDMLISTSDLRPPVQVRKLEVTTPEHQG
jgi:hypothetical protein